MTKGIASVAVFVLAVTGILSQQWEEERGLVMSVYSYYYYETLMHYGKFPGYEDVSDVEEEGLAFSNDNIRLYSVDVDYRTRTLFMYDNYYRAIFYGSGYNKALSNMNFGVMHYGVSRGAMQFAVDWQSRTLYWCDSVYRWIIAAPSQVDKMDSNFYKIIAYDHLYSPSGIAVDPMGGLLFWMDGGDKPKIERSNLLGEDRETIVSGGMNGPGHIEVDLNDKRIYWIQTGSRTLHSAKYDGTDSKTIYTNTDARLYDLAIFRSAGMEILVSSSRLKGAKIPLWSVDVKYSGLVSIETKAVLTRGSWGRMTDVVYLTDTYNDYIYTLNKNTGVEEADPVSFAYYTIYDIAVYSEENQPMKDTDYCAQLNCEQLCISTSTGAVCACAEGYENVGGSCQESDAGLHKALVIASTTHICFVDILTFASFAYKPVCRFSVLPQTPTTTPSGGSLGIGGTPAADDGDLIKTIEINQKELTVYYASGDNKIYARPLVLPIEDNAKDLIATASGEINGLAFDTVDSELYWTETLQNDDGNIRSVNVNDKMVILRNPDNVTPKSPRNILFLQLQRRLAWVEGETGNVSIQTMNNDGTGLLYVTDHYDITSLTVDQESQIFYFLYQSSFGYVSVYSVPVDGSAESTRMYISVSDTAYHLIHYNNYLAWLYKTEGYANTMSTYDYVENTYIGGGYFDNETIIIDFQVLDVKLQSPERISPCANANGGCAHSCTTKYVSNQLTKICECRFGFTLQDDKMGCYSEVASDNFLLASDWTNDEILQFEILTKKANAIPIADIVSMMGIYFDAESKKLIWSEYLNSKVFIANLNGTDRQILSELESSNAYRFAKDISTGNIYYTGYSSDQIGIITPSGVNIMINEDFVWEDLRAIAVHPEKGWLYFSATDYPDSYIARSDMDGKNVVKLIEGGLVESPDGLAIDYINGYLFWCDASYDIIQRCNLDAEDCMTIVNATGDEEQITDIVTDWEYVYYSTHKTTRVVQVNLTEPFDRVVIGYDDALGKLDTIALYRSGNKNLQSGISACADNGGLSDCSTICLPTPNGRTCACEGDVPLADDERTCSNIHQCNSTIDITSIPAASNDKDLSVTFETSCLRRMNNTCEYKCPPKYKPVDKTNINLICTADGWDRENDTLCEELVCPLEIENGVLRDCEREPGDACEFLCNDGFTKTEKKAFCNKEAFWHTTNLCRPSECPEAVSQATGDKIDIKISSTCSRQIGQKCGYTCPSKYVPADSSNTDLTCALTGWDRASQQLCTLIRCPQTIGNGVLYENCSRETGHVCGFSCNQGYRKTEEKTFCQTDGTWHKAVDGFCTNESLPKVSKQDGFSKEEAMIGIVVFVVVIFTLLLVITGFVCRHIRSKKLSYNEGRASFHRNGTATVDKPYSTTSARDTGSVRDGSSEYSAGYIQPRLRDSSSVGMVNPAYRMQEPLPVASQVVLSTSNKVYYDAWLKNVRR